MPLHELVQAAHVPNEFIAGTQVEMIGVGKHERGIDLLEVFGREGFYRGLRANGRKDRCEQVAVGSGEDARAGMVVFGLDLELEHWGNYTIFEIR